RFRGLCDHRDRSAPRSLVRSARPAHQDRAHHGPPSGRARPCGESMSYFVLKFLHLIGAAVLLGTGAGIAFFMVLAHRGRNAAMIAGVARMVVIADFVFTATAVVVQPVTGALLVLEVGYAFSDAWVVWSLILYVFAGAFWLPVVFMQMRMRDLA